MTMTPWKKRLGAEKKYNVGKSVDVWRKKGRVVGGKKKGAAAEEVVGQEKNNPA